MIATPLSSWSSRTSPPSSKVCSVSGIYRIVGVGITSVPITWPRLISFRILITLTESITVLQLQYRTVLLVSVKGFFPLSCFDRVCPGLVCYVARTQEPEQSIEDFRGVAGGEWGPRQVRWKEQSREEIRWSKSQSWRIKLSWSKNQDLKGWWMAWVEILKYVRVQISWLIVKKERILKIRTTVERGTHEGMTGVQDHDYQDWSEVSHSSWSLWFKMMF